jgi:hypothetical protein
MADKVPVMAKNPAQYGSEKGCPQHRPYDCVPHCDRCNDWRQLRELRADLARFTKAYDDEVTGRRAEVAGCHAEMGRLRADLARVTEERDHAHGDIKTLGELGAKREALLKAARAETERLREAWAAWLLRGEWFETDGLIQFRTTNSTGLPEEVRQLAMQKAQALTSDPEPTT